MKVAQLREVLSHYPTDAEVIVTYEGVTRELDAENVYISTKEYSGHDPGTVVIDADHNGYKESDFGGKSL